jgi:hypothetical protein
VVGVVVGVAVAMPPWCPRSAAHGLQIVVITLTLSPMKLTKRQAVQAFGGKTRHLAEALGISRPAVAQWPTELTQRQAHEVIGAAWCRGVLERLVGDRHPPAA